MKKYIVEFWYYTDLRTIVKVEAMTEVNALVLALEELQPQLDGNKWINSSGFKIQIVAG